MQNYVESKVRDIVDFPKKGIIFRDITTAVKDAKAMKFMIDFLTEIRIFFQKVKFFF